MAKLKAINPDAKPLSEIAEYRKPTKFAELDIILGEVVNTLWEKIASLNDEIGSLKKTNKELNERVSKLETSNASGGGTTPGQPLFSSLFSGDKSTEAEVQILAKVHREIKAKKKQRTEHDCERHTRGSQRVRGRESGT
jgi:hypothetical protein